MTYATLASEVKLMSERLGTPLTLYYIGNCSTFAFDPSRPRFYPGNYDDRSWAIRFDAFEDSDRHHYALHNLVLGETEEWKAMEPRELRLALEIRAMRLMRRHAELAVAA